MADKRITLSDIKKLGCNAILWDSDVNGLAIRRQQGDTSSWVLKYRTHDNRQRFYTIGKTNIFLPDEARKEARKLLSEVAKGNDPAKDKGDKRKAATIAELAKLYMEDAEKGLIITKYNVPKRQSTLVLDRSRLNAHILPALGAMKITALTKQDVVSLKEVIQFSKVGKGRHPSNRGGPGAASRSISFLSALFNWAIEKGYCSANPCIGVKRPPDRRRDRRLNDTEYKALAALLANPRPTRSDRPGSATPFRRQPHAPAVVRFLALTGWRRGEVLGLKWKELDLERRLATLNETKTGKSERVLSLAAIEVLNSFPKMEDCELVFPATNGKMMVSFAATFDRFTPAPDITAHVMRHSFASVAADLGFSDAIIAPLIGHKGGGITRRYIHPADPVLLAAADAVANEINKKMKIQDN